MLPTSSPVSQMERACLLCVLRFPLTPGGGWERRMGSGGAHLAPIPIWNWGPAEGHTWAQEPGSTTRACSTGMAFVLGRAAVSKAAPAT